MSAIELVAEPESGAGNLDFLLLGSLVQGGLARLCVEFKNAHSREVIDGLMIQLPAYMEAHHATFGAYCVLSYKGEWFDKPTAFTINELEDNLKRRQAPLLNPIQEGIRIYVFDLSKPASASKRRRRGGKAV